MGCGCLRRNEVFEPSYIKSIKESDNSKKFSHCSNKNNSYISNNSSKKFEITSEEDVSEKIIKIKKTDENSDYIMTTTGKEKTERNTMNYCSTEKSDDIKRINSLSFSPHKKEGPIISLLRKQNSIHLKKACK